MSKIIRSWFWPFALWLCAQGPLVWLYTQTDGPTSLRVLKHAPNQFLFLLLFFLPASLACWQMVRMIGQLGYDHQVVGSYSWWVWGYRRGGVFVIAVLLGTSLAAVETVNTPVDFYGKRPEIVIRAAQINETLATLGARGENREQLKKELAELYKEPDVRGALPLLEWLELSSALFVALSIAGFSVMVLKMRSAFKSHNAVRQDLRQFAVWLILAALAFAPWCPLRAHNIIEIRAVLREYRTIEPMVILPCFALALLYALVIYYWDLQKVMKAIRTLIGGFAAVGGFWVVSWFTQKPDNLGPLLHNMNLTALITAAIIVALLGFLLLNLLRIPAGNGGSGTGAAEQN